MTLYDDALLFVREKTSDDATGHGHLHAQRVCGIAFELYGKDNALMLAALLHDVEDHKFSREGQVDGWLKEHVDDEIREEVHSLIAQVSFSNRKEPSSAKSAALQDADRLDAMGAIGIARAFATGSHLGRPLEQTIHHFHDKLLKLKGGMHTQKGRELAETRHAFMVSFLDEWEKEKKRNL